MDGANSPPTNSIRKATIKRKRLPTTKGRDIASLLPLAYRTMAIKMQWADAYAALKARQCPAGSGLREQNAPLAITAALPQPAHGVRHEGAEHDNVRNPRHPTKHTKHRIAGRPKPTQSADTEAKPGS